MRSTTPASSGARFDLPTGTIYPALRRLEAAGLVKGTWAEVGGRCRHTYLLTPAGCAHARAGRPASRPGVSCRQRAGSPRRPDSQLDSQQPLAGGVGQTTDCSCRYCCSRSMGLPLIVLRRWSSLQYAGSR